MTRAISSILGSDLKAYWRAEDASVAGDGNPVASWVDSVGSYDFANTDGATQPVYHADYSSTGYAAIKFDGINQFLAVSDSDLNFPGGWLAFAVLRRTASTATQTVFSNFTDSSNYTRFRDQGTRVAIQDTTTVAGLQYVNTTKDPMAVAFRYASGACSVITLEQSGGGLLAANYYTTGTPHSSDDWYLGKRGDASVQPWDGAVNVFALASPSIDTRTILEVLTQFRYDYGISDSDSEPVEPSAGGGYAGFTGLRGVTGGLGT